MTHKQALVALILLSIEFNRNIYIINNENLSSSLLLAIIPPASSISKPLFHYFTSMKESEPISQKKKQFKASYPLDDVTLHFRLLWL